VLVSTSQSLRSIHVHAAWTLAATGILLFCGEMVGVSCYQLPWTNANANTNTRSKSQPQSPMQGRTPQQVFNWPNARWNSPAGGLDSLTLGRSNQCKVKQPDWCLKELNRAATDHQQFLGHCMYPHNAAWQCQLTFAVPLRGFLVRFASLSALRSPSSGLSQAQALEAQGSRLGLEIWQAQALESWA